MAPALHVLVGKRQSGQSCFKGRQGDIVAGRLIGTAASVQRQAQIGNDSHREFIVIVQLIASCAVAAVIITIVIIIIIISIARHCRWLVIAATVAAAVNGVHVQQSGLLSGALVVVNGGNGAAVQIAIAVVVAILWRGKQARSAADVARRGGRRVVFSRTTANHWTVHRRWLGLMRLLLLLLMLLMLLLL